MYNLSTLCPQTLTAERASARTSRNLFISDKTFTSYANIVHNPRILAIPREKWIGIRSVILYLAAEKRFWK